MPKFVITLQFTPGKDYGPLWTELTRLQVRPLMTTQWAANIVNANAVQMRDHLRQYLAPTDRILVMDRDSADWAGFNLMGRLDQM